MSLDEIRQDLITAGTAISLATHRLRVGDVCHAPAALNAALDKVEGAARDIRLALASIQPPQAAVSVERQTVLKGEA